MQFLLLAGIYIHIPFCKQACTYCDFYFSTALAAKPLVIAAIIKEIGLRNDYLNKEKISSIYFGGGSPSLLNEVDLKKIMECIRIFFPFDSPIEITFEANPDDITLESLKTWKEAGINRLSIGLQSFNNSELKWMNRTHLAETGINSVKLAQKAGFDNITIDLIYGSRFQSIVSWSKTLQQAIDLNVQHISCYNLTIESRTKLGADHKKGREPMISEELSAAQFFIAVDMLKEAGFLHYEISNFGKPGFFAVHNSNYWLQRNYIGIGPSAHSYNGISRQWNVRNNNLYVKAIENNNEFYEKEELTLKNKYNEYVLTRLRTIWGCDKNEIAAKFGDEISKYFNACVAEKSEFIDEKNGVVTLNRKGMLQADGIASDLFLH